MKSMYKTSMRHVLDFKIWNNLYRTMYSRMCEHISQYQESGYIFLFNILGDITDHVSSIYLLLVDRCLNYFNKYNFTSLSINLTIIHYINSEDKTQSWFIWYCTK